MSKKEETVRVCVRCRPLNSKEKADGRERIVRMDANRGSCTVQPPGSSEPPKDERPPLSPYGAAQRRISLSRGVLPEAGGWG